MDKLTLEHLAPYLPYGLKVVSKINNYSYSVLGACKEEILIQDDLNGWYAISNFKPILRPLSDLTKEIEHKGYRFIARNQIDQYTQVGADRKLYVLVDGTHWSCNPLEWDYQTVLWLIGLHFDVFGLHEKGLCVYYNEI